MNTKAKILLPAFALALVNLLGCATTEVDDESSEEALATLPALAKISCETAKAIGSDRTKQKFEMYLKGLNTGKDETTSWTDKSEGDDGPVIVSQESVLFALNENTAAELKKTELLVHGDSDGFFLIDLKLTRSSGLKKGTIAIKDLGDGFAKSKLSTDVSCTVTDIGKPSGTGSSGSGSSGSGSKLLPSGASCLTNAQCASGTCIHGIAEYTCL